MARCDRSRHVRFDGIQLKERQGASWGRLSLVRSGRSEGGDVAGLDGEERAVSMGDVELDGWTIYLNVFRARRGGHTVRIRMQGRERACHGRSQSHREWYCHCCRET